MPRRSNLSSQSATASWHCPIPKTNLSGTTRSKVFTVLVALIGLLRCPGQVVANARYHRDARGRYLDADAASNAGITNANAAVIGRAVVVGGRGAAGHAGQHGRSKHGTLRPDHDLPSSLGVAVLIPCHAQHTIRFHRRCQYLQAIHLAVHPCATLLLGTCSASNLSRCRRLMCETASSPFLTCGRVISLSAV